MSEGSGAVGWGRQGATGMGMRNSVRSGIAIRRRKDAGAERRSEGE